VGLGFVLLVWAVILGGAAVAAGVVGGVWSWWNHRRLFGRAELFKAAAAAALPLVVLAYAGAAFVGYAIWCESIRGVDLGIGDSWRVPVANDYYFCMIDVPDKGYLLKGGCSGGPVVDGITELAAAGDLVAGNSESHGPFVLDTRTGALQRLSRVDDALARITPRPALLDAYAFYGSRRWGRADVFAALLIGIPALAAAFFWYWWFIRLSPARRGSLR
jgi:hypothetical protein